MSVNLPSWIHLGHSQPISPQIKSLRLAYCLYRQVSPLDPAPTRQHLAQTLHRSADKLEQDTIKLREIYQLLWQLLLHTFEIAERER